MLVSESAVSPVIDEVKLKAEDFYLDRHRLVFACLYDLYGSSSATDELSAIEALKSRGELAKAGDRHYVAELAANVAAVGNAAHHARIVQEGSRKRRLVNRLGEIRGGLHNGTASLEARQELEELLGEIEAVGAPDSSLIDFTEITAKAVRWAWRDRIALAKLTALAGRPKIGKGLLYSHLIADVTRGTLDGDLGQPRHAIITTTEDEPGDTLKPRLMAAGADLSRVSMFQMGSTDEPIPFRVPQDADELGRRVAEREAALVVIDPLMEFIDGKTDSHKSHPVRQAVAALNAVARQYGCAVLVIFHLNKGISTDPLLRHEGAAAFTQIVRGGLMLGFDPDDPEGEEGDQRALAVSASNLAQLAPSLAYRIDTAHVEGDAGEEISTARLVELGESTAASHELLRGREDEEARADRDEATKFLEGELAEGPRGAGEIKSAADQAGIGPSALKRAKRELHVVSEKAGMRSGWTWALPDRDVPEAPSPSTPSTSSAFQAENEGPEEDEGDARKSAFLHEGDEGAEGDHADRGPGCASHPEPVADCRYCRETA